MRRLGAILLWSVIAAAFIGPGTVTTCAAAGAAHGATLLWALAFSTVATLVLQEASARLSAVSGQDLAEALRGTGGAMVVLVLGAVLLGCAAYEAGNLLGAAAGSSLVLGISPRFLAAGAGTLAGLLLWLGAPGTVARTLAILVALMGIAFLATAALVRPPAAEIVQGLLIPRTPPGAGLLVLGLVGTTVVPYNLFLGSGLAVGQRLGEIRFGLAISVLLGGAISMGIVLVGAATVGPFAFDAMAATLADRLGGWAAGFFGWGLAAAGLSSAITAPLAAALTARGLFGGGADDPRWAPRAWRYRAVWGGVLLAGVAFGVSDVRPVPAILLAQAFNGVLLPVAAIFLLLAVNDRRLLGDALNGALANLLAAAVVLVTVVLGAAGVLRAGAAALGRPAPGEAWLLGTGLLLGLGLAVPVGRKIAGRRRSATPG